MGEFIQIEPFVFIIGGDRIEGVVKIKTVYKESYSIHRIIKNPNSREVRGQQDTRSHWDDGIVYTIKVSTRQSFSFYLKYTT